MPLSDLEARRLAQIEERNLKFKELFGDTEEFSLLRNTSTPRTKASGRGRSKSCRGRKMPGKVVVTRHSPPRTRYGGCALRSGKKLVDAIELDSDYDDKPRSKKRPRKSNKVRVVMHRNEYERTFLNPEDVTDAQLDAIALSTTEKVYSKYHGTSCHQCRQKTLDTKTVCRRKDCYGVRGQFCGPCLRNRYGEDVAAALKDPNWECPICRDICNCSFCRPLKGKLCTGIMIHAARQNGFHNVKDYLKNEVDSDEEVIEDSDENDELEEIRTDGNERADENDELEEVGTDGNEHADKNGELEEVGTDGNENADENGVLEEVGTDGNEHVHENYELEEVGTDGNERGVSD